jgi:hypothetical protein
MHLSTIIFEGWAPVQGFKGAFPNAETEVRLNPNESIRTFLAATPQPPTETLR